MKLAYSFLLAFPFLFGCWGEKRKSTRLEPVYESKGVNVLARQVDQLLQSSRQARAELELLKPKIASHSAKTIESATNLADTFSVTDSVASETSKPSSGAGTNSRNGAKSPPASSSRVQISLSYGKIPFGKTARQLGFFSQTTKPAFGHHLPDEIKQFIKTGYTYGLNPGYADDYMDKLSIKNFRATERSYDNIELFFVGEGVEKKLGIVGKKITIPIDDDDHVSPFKGMIKRISDKVESRPDLSDTSDSYFFNGGDLKFYGQYAGWLLQKEIVVLLSEEVSVEGFSDTEKRDIHIISISRDALDEYDRLEAKGRNEKASAGEAALESAFWLLRFSL